MGNLKNEIMDALRLGVPVIPQELMKQTDCTKMNDLFKIINELESEGRLVITEEGKIMSVDSAGFTRAVILSLSEKFAFARPEEGEDIYINAHNMKGALPGDTVLLKTWHNHGRGDEGEVFSIVLQESHMSTGRVTQENGRLMFEPQGKYRMRIPLRKSAKSGLKGGEKIRVNIVPATGKKRKGEPLGAKIVSIYGDANSAKVCSDAIIDEAGIPTVFSDVVLEEAKQLFLKPEEIKKRLDLRNELIFTIDGADAKDLDDAISIKKVKNGWELGVHIADVSHYVKAFSALDKDAFERGTSVYFADRVVPMYPEALSNGVCSLNANEDKLTFSAILKLDSRAELIGYTFKKSVIRSKVRGVYSEVNQILAGTAENDLLKKYEPVTESIRLAFELYQLIKENAQKRGVLRLESREVRFELDENGVCSGIYPRERGIAEEIIEQFMITANVAAARFSREHELPFIYRVHESPNEKKLDELTEFAAALGLKTSVLHGDITNEKLGILLNQAEEKGCALIVSDKILRSMAKARYDENPIGHFGLSLADYSHFTSPIRRYPDTSIHRIMSDFLSGMSKEEVKKRYSNFVASSSAQSSQCELRAMSAERDAESCYMSEYMAGKVGEEYEGMVRSVMPFGAYVTLDMGAEGLIRIENLPGDNYIFDGKMALSDRISGTGIKVGDRVRICVEAADVSLGQVDFSLISVLPK